jgi:hypothetical protein
LLIPSFLPSPLKLGNHSFLFRTSRLNSSASLSFYQPPVLFPPAHPPPKLRSCPRLPRELIRHEEPPQALTAFPDALSPA